MVVVIFCFDWKDGATFSQVGGIRRVTPRSIAGDNNVSLSIEGLLCEY